MTTHAEQIERTRLAVQAAAMEVEQLVQWEQSRALSLALTNAQQAAMWHGWHEGELGRFVSPYPTADHDQPHFVSGGRVGGVSEGVPLYPGDDPLPPLAREAMQRTFGIMGGASVADVKAKPDPWAGHPSAPHPRLR